MPMSKRCDPQSAYQGSQVAYYMSRQAADKALAMLKSSPESALSDLHRDRTFAMAHSARK